MSQTKYCYDCQKDLPIDFFYVTTRGGHSVYCKKHSLARVVKTKKKKKIEEEFVNHCPPEPNTFFNERQKEQVFEFLYTLGWTWNEENKIWFKSGIKDETGNWLKIVPKPIEKK